MIFWGDLTYNSAKKESLLVTGTPRCNEPLCSKPFVQRTSVGPTAAFLAEISVSSPWKLFIFIIYRNIFLIKVSKNYFIWFWRQKHECGYSRHQQNWSDGSLYNKSSVWRTLFGTPDEFVTSRCICRAVLLQRNVKAKPTGRRASSGKDKVRTVTTQNKLNTCKPHTYEHSLCCNTTTYKPHTN